MNIRARQAWDWWREGQNTKSRDKRSDEGTYEPTQSIAGKKRKRRSTIFSTRSRKSSVTTASNTTAANVQDIVSWTFATDANAQGLYIDCADPTISLSHGDVRTLVQKIVGGLNHLQIQRGDCVCVSSFNSVYYTALYLGVIGSGGIFTGANPGYKTDDLAHHLRMTSAKVVFAELSTLPTVLAAAVIVGLPKSKVVVLNYSGEAIPDGCISWLELLSHEEKEWVRVEDPSNTIACYGSTSGTSGLPKAAILTHSFLIEQGKFQEELLDSRMTQLIAVPPFHAFTVPVQHALPLRKSVVTYIMPRFKEDAFVDALQRYQIARTVAVPPIMLALSTRSAEELQSLRRVFVGGSPAPDTMQQMMYSKLHPEAKITQVYGMTEVGWAAVWQRPERDLAGSVGQPIPGTKMRIVCTRREVKVKDGLQGEVQIFCPGQMKGYLGNKQATSEAFSADGWVRTGDIGVVVDGNWYITDRIKDLIKVRGFQVSPAEIEAILVTHPDIIDCGVIGVPAPDGCGDSPVAYIARREGSSLDASSVQAFLSAHLARYKNVDEVLFIDKIPRSPTGKILRREMRVLSAERPKTPAQVVAAEYRNALASMASKHALSSRVEVKPLTMVHT